MTEIHNRNGKYSLIRDLANYAVYVLLVLTGWLLLNVSDMQRQLAVTNTKLDNQIELTKKIDGLEKEISLLKIQITEIKR
jgi:hypothetical protein